MRTVELVPWTEALERISAVVRDSIPDDRLLDVVEAGCGRQWDLNVDSNSCSITGIDVDADALAARMERHGDLDRPLVGDVQDPTLVEEGSVDLVYSAYVLEHLPHAETAARAWASWLRPGGRLILLVPDAQATYGFLSRRTPHACHVWFYRRILGRPLAGTPGHAPYPVSYSRLLTVGGVERFAEEEGLTVTSVLAIGDMRPRRNTREAVRNSVIDFVKRTVSLASFGRLKWRHDNLGVILTKLER